MSLRLRIILALAVLASLASIAIGLSSYRSTRVQLLKAVDQSLDAASLARGPQLRELCSDPDGDAPPRALRGIVLQLVTRDAAVTSCADVLPLTKRDRDLIGAGRGRVRHNVSTANGEQFRVLSIAVPSGGVVQFARSLTETNDSLSHIARRTLWAVMAIAIGAVLIGWWIGRQVTRRLEHLTDAARQVASTGSLDLEVPVHGNDEVTTLAQSMQAMLAALAASRAAQRQLVQDAGHELRTPLTSLRTNVSVLRRYDQLAADSRQQILDDLDSETRELTALVNELVDLATDRASDEVAQTANLGELARRIVERATRRSGRDITLSADQSTAVVRVGAVERAMQNLVDNAVKFAPTGPIEMAVHNGRIAVRDHGPGLAAGDEVNVFQRFYRAVQARSLPGSGLGLSIVQTVAESHGGTVFATNAPGGGAEIGFTLPLMLPPPSAGSSAGGG